jgi:hypothetical protein
LPGRQLFSVRTGLVNLRLKSDRLPIPNIRNSGFSASLSSITAARPRRNFTAFPIRRYDQVSQAATAG